MTHSSKTKRHVERLRRALSPTDTPKRPAPGTAREEAAVLVPLIERQDELYVVYIRRSDAVESHRGQVAFPGGRVSPSDATLLETALREAYEEVGIEPAAVEVLGGFSTMHTVSTGLAVAPFVGLVPGAAKLHRDPAEVAEIFEVPLVALADPRYRGVYEWRHERGGFSSTFPAILYRGYTIWGLTLRITESLLVMLAMDGGAASFAR
jgi:8-oxo-dGTP pyrophosphatase MutT (NUDIX family)